MLILVSGGIAVLTRLILQNAILINFVYFSNFQFDFIVIMSLFLASRWDSEGDSSRPIIRSIVVSGNRKSIKKTDERIVEEENRMLFNCECHIDHHDHCYYSSVLCDIC